MKGRWHAIDTAEVLTELGSCPEGLSSAEAARRLESYGPNELQEKKRQTLLSMFLEQFKDFMIIVLLAAAVVSGIIGEISDTITIIIIVILNAIIGFAQQFRAEKAMQALRKMTSPETTVIRDGSAVRISSLDIVPGDIALLESGNIVPADMRLIEVASCKVQEAALTGESMPVDKSLTLKSDGDTCTIGDMENMVFKGTEVCYGRGRGVVVATGMSTELGKIASMLEGQEEGFTPLQKRLAAFGRRLALVILAICAVVFVFGLFRGEPPLLMLLTSISLAVAAIPEALPAVVTISLALGARKLVKQNALIRKLPAVETLGSVTYICSDKTGTLTMNRMAVEEVYVGGRLMKASELKEAELLRALALSNDVDAGGEGEAIGEPTEVALYELAKSSGYLKYALLSGMPRVAEVPFDSTRKRMTTIHKHPGGGYVSFTKGAVEVLHDNLSDGLTDGLQDMAERMASDGLRVICVAMRRWEAMPEAAEPDSLESGLTLLGLVGLMDPPRPEVAEAVATCKRAGIKPVMITGDHPLTALAIAKRLGIVSDGLETVITGKELASMSEEEFEERVEGIRVYARVAPEQKLRIVEALQNRGQFVAMTGDGVNDAPALKRADIGVAMGITGTDVSKEASHMILRDDNFATIVKAVREGRRIFDNIRKFIKYTMTSNAGEIITIAAAPLFGMPIPLLPIHILWINLVTDGLPGLAYAVEPPERGVMDKAPRHPKQSIFADRLAWHIVWVGILMGTVPLSTQGWFLSHGGHWQTMVFTVLCLSQLGNALAIRSDRDSLFAIGLFSNKFMLAAVALTIALQMAVIYIPWLSNIFKTEPLTASELAISLALSTVVFICVEAEKLLRRVLAKI